MTINRPPSTPPSSNVINAYRRRRRHSSISGISILAGLFVLGGIAVLIYWLRQPGQPLSTLFATDTPTPTITYTPTNTSTPTETQIPPTSTPMPPTFTPAPPVGSFILSDNVVMMYVPAGAFSMGGEAHGDEKPIHTVNLDAYYIDKFEVTNAAYKRCVDAGVCNPPKQSDSYSRQAYYGNPKFDEYPVIYVDWNMAKIYCEWRGGRLPAEAEWEKAARGMDGRTYPWGNDFDGTKLNFCDKNCVFGWAKKNVGDGYADTAPAGSYLDGVSPYGVHDMAGNVWEWVNDWYGSVYYQISPSLNPWGPDSGEYRVLRGGAWEDKQSNVRSANRSWTGPETFYNSVGFRCARGISP